MSKSGENTKVEDYEPPDEIYKKIVDQIDDENRLQDLCDELKSFVEYANVPLLEKLNIENLGEFLCPKRVRVF